MKINATIASILVTATALIAQMQPCHAGQDVRDEAGQMFMEETTPPPPAASQQKRVPIDLSNVGVPVDERGRIVPLIDRSSPDGVRRNFSNLETYSEPPVIAVPVYGAPYGGYGYPRYGSPYGGYGYRPPYGVPYGGYGYRPPFGVPFASPYGSPYGNYGNGIGFNLGRLRINLGSGYGGYGYNPYGYGGSPYGYGGSPSGFGGSPFGFGGSPFGFGGSPFGFGGNPYGYGSAYGYGNPYRFNNPYVTGNPYGLAGGYSPVGGLFGPSPFPIYSSPLLGSSLFSGNGGGFGLSILPKVEWQSTGTVTPLIPQTLDTTDQ